MLQNDITLQKLIQGDRKTFLSVFDEYYKNLCIFLNRFLTNPADCEDCVQEAFIALWNNRFDMASMAHVKAFLYQVCRNNALNVIKHEKIKNEHCALIHRELESSDLFINYVIEEEVERILSKTEKQLPQKCREIFILAMQGKSNSEIAIKLGISENTVKTQKKIAYKRLKYNISEISLMILLI